MGIAISFYRICMMFFPLSNENLSTVEQLLSSYHTNKLTKTELTSNILIY